MAIIISPAFANQADGPIVPPAFLYDGADLAAVAERIESEDRRLALAVDRLRDVAEAAMPKGSFSLVNKPKLAPSGDRHDSFSHACYVGPLILTWPRLSAVEQHPIDGQGVGVAIRRAAECRAAERRPVAGNEHCVVGTARVEQAADVHRPAALGEIRLAMYLAAVTDNGRDDVPRNDRSRGQRRASGS